jgi:hypothetical protein
LGSPIFNLGLLKHYQVLDRPGTFIVSVAYDVNKEDLYVKDDYPRYIIPLRVIRSEDLPMLVKILKDGSVPFYTIRKLFVSGAIFENDDIDLTTLPIKGEKVAATFELKNDKLQCTHIKLIDRDDLMYVNFSAIDNLYSLAVEFLSKDYE